MKTVIKGIVRTLGYEIRSLVPQAVDPDSIAIKTVKESQHYAKWVSPTPIYCAWLGDERFSRIFRIISEHTIVSIDRCYLLYCLAWHAANLHGEFAECGVYKGGTARLLCEAAPVTKTVHLFD